MSESFLEDIKNMLNSGEVPGMYTSVKDEKSHILSSHSPPQIVSESFLEDINNMLNSGEVPGMYTSEEKDKVCADIRDWVMNRGGNPTKVRAWIGVQE